jgi:Notch-like protein
MLSKIIRTAKKLYYNNKILHAHNKTKATWKINKDDMGVNNSKENDRDKMINCENYSQKINAENFNDYFINITNNNSEKIKSDNNSNNHVTTYSPLFQICKLKYDNIIFRNTTTDEIESFIKKLPLKGLSGYDEVSTSILEVGATFSSSPLCSIINKSLSSGIFPDRLKYSRGDKNNVSNYRPISLLTAFSKVFEKVIYKRLNDHFLTNNILTKSQFGFKKTSPTTNAAYKLINDILQALKNKNKYGGIFFDLEKSFDCVDHNILMNKISYYGVNCVFLMNKIIFRKQISKD